MLYVFPYNRRSLHRNFISGARFIWKLSPVRHLDPGHRCLLHPGQASSPCSGGCLLSSSFSPLNSYGVLFASVIVAILSLGSLLRRPGVRGTSVPWLVGLCLVGSGMVAVF